MFVGLDIHKNYVQAAVMDKEGRLLKEARIPNNIHDIHCFFSDMNMSRSSWNLLAHGTISMNS